MTYLPPVVINITGTDADLIATLADAKAQLLEFAKGVYDAQLGTDQEPLVAELATARAALLEWARTTADANLGVDMAEFYSDFAAMRAEAAKGITVPINTETGGLLAKGVLGGLLGSAGGLLGGLLGGGGSGGSLLGRLLGYGGGGLFGLAPVGSLADFMGFGGEGLVLGPGVGVAGSALGALLGAGFLGLGAAGTGAVGMGTDLAGIGQATADLQKYRTALSQLKTAIATYGAGSTEAAQAQNQLNAALAGMPAAARGAIVALSGTVTQFITLFDKATGVAEAKGAAIIQSLVKTGEAFLPTIGAFASSNMTIIMTALQPFEKWLDTSGKSGGLGIFTQLEKVFQSNLPTGMNALTQGFELLAKTIELISPDLGKFTAWLSGFLTRMNGATFSKWSHFVESMITDFTAWFKFLVQIGKTLMDLLGPVAHVGAAIVRFLTTVLKTLGQWLTKNRGLLSEFFSVHFTEIIQGFGGVIKALLPALESLVGEFMKIAAVARPLATDVLTALAKAIQNINLGPVIQGAGKLIIAVFNGLTPAFKALGPLLQTVGTLLGSVLLNAVKSLQPIIAPLAQAIGSALAAAIKTATTLLKALTPAIITLAKLTRTLSPVIGFLAKVLGVTLVVAIKLLTPVLQLLAAVIDQVVSGAVKSWDQLKSVAVTIWDDILSFFKGLPSKMVTIGKDIVDGLAHGITGAVRDVVNAAKSVAHDAWHAVTSFFGIFSPSRLMMTVGNTVVEGLAKGIKTAHSHIAAAQKVAADVKSALTPLLPKEGYTIGQNFDIQMAKAILASKTVVVAAAAQMGREAASAVNSQLAGVGSGAGSAVLTRLKAGTVMR